MEFLKQKGQGILLCMAIALPTWIAVKSVHGLEIIGAPIIGILIGMILSSVLKDKSNVKEGIAFTSKKILQFAVILLGFGLNLRTVGQVGMTSLPIILLTIATSLVVAFLLNKALNAPEKISILIGVGSSICGGSAIAATAPVIQADDEEIAGAISVIFLFNVIAALIFPSLGSALGLSNEGFGLFAGTAVNDMSSVTAAASTWDTMHGTDGLVLAYATIVKLTRTLAIIPITLGLSYLRFRSAKNKGDDRQQANVGQPPAFSIKKVFPMFILYFVLASVLTTVVTSLASGKALEIAASGFSQLNQLSKFLIVMAMSAIGLNTDIVKLIKSGKKPLFMGFCCWLSILSVSLVLQKLLHLF